MLQRVSTKFRESSTKHGLLSHARSATFHESWGVIWQRCGILQSLSSRPFRTSARGTSDSMAEQREWSALRVRDTFLQYFKDRGHTFGTCISPCCTCEELNIREKISKTALSSELVKGLLRSQISISVSPSYIITTKRKHIEGEHGTRMSSNCYIHFRNNVRVADQ